MRGTSTPQGSMFLAVPIEKRIPDGHPLRRIKQFVDEALAQLHDRFNEMYSAKGRPSIPPERLLKASLLMAFYAVRSERLFCERLEWDLLFRWFLDMDINESAFNHSTFSHNRERLIEQDIALEFFKLVVDQARKMHLISNEHFTVDGTLIESWASVKSFRPKDEEKRPDDDDPGNPTVDFRGEKRSNKTHESTTDPEARLARKSRGQTAKLCFGAHALMENRNGLLVDIEITQATGTAEVDAALIMAARTIMASGATLGADKGYDCGRAVSGLKELDVTPHIAGKKTRSSVDAQLAQDEAYAVSQKKRKLVEEIFGWIKGTANWRKTRYKGVRLNQFMGYIMGAAYNLVRIGNLSMQTAT